MAEARKLAAILFADVVGYSRLAGADVERTLARLRGLHSDLIDPAIAAHHGRIVKRTGDGSLIEFRSVVDAVRCAIEVQTGLIDRNAGVQPGSISRSPSSARKSSRTSPNRSGSIRSTSASPPVGKPPRPQRPKKTPHRAFRLWSCRSPILAAVRTRSISWTGSRRASPPISRGYEAQS
jgi:hypothetical protein